jgi:hypothetical protein
VKKKSTTKIENTEIESPINEPEIKEDGGKKTQKTNLEKIIRKAQSVTYPSHFKICIDHLNEENIKIVNSLWEWGCIFVVTSLDLSYLNKVNIDITNRSYSLGRWYYTNSNDIYNQQCDLLVLCRDKYDSSNSFKFAKETIKYYED